MGISSPGIGSGLDINGLVSKLMAVESQPLQAFDKKEASLQSKISALGSLNGGVASLQSSLTSLSNQSTFQSVSASPSDSTVFAASASSKAVAGIYSVNVKQIAQSQTLATNGLASSSTAIGNGGTTTLSFRLGTISGGAFGIAGSTLGGSVASAGIAEGSLSINGTTITTDASTKSAKALAAAINTKSSTTGVNASAGTTSTSATLFGSNATSSFGDIDTSGGGTYSLSIGGVEIASQLAGVAAGAGVTAASIDSILSGNNATTTALSAANITFSGSAATGTLQFFNTDGSNITVTESVTGSVNGGIATSSASANIGTSVTNTASISISSSNATPITVAGNNPALAGLTAGTGGAYIGSSFSQDGNQSTGTVVIDSSNNSLQGIRDAINKANIGVTATIVSDGSSTPYHLVIGSTKTGINSSIKIDVSGQVGDTALSDLLSYDPAGTQKLIQNTAAQSTKLSVNGIDVASSNNTVTDAIQGVTLTISKVGSSTLNVSRDTAGIKSGVQAFVKAFNDFNTTVKNLTAFDPATKKAGPLLGDPTAQLVQNQVRKQLSTTINGLSGSLTNLSQVGISFQKDGSLALDSSKLNTAITNNYNDIIGLFAAIGTTSDALINFTSSTAKTKAGTYSVDVTSLASQGKLAGSLDLTAGNTTIANGTSWSVTLNGTSPTTASTVATVTLPPGSYNSSELASLVQSAINGASSFVNSGSTVTASINDSGQLEVKSNKYGSVSNLSITSLTGTAVSDVFGSTTETSGTDVVGTIGGLSATGSGQFLTAAAGSDADGLKLEIAAGGIGARGTVSFSQGYAYQLNNLAAGFLGSTGLIAGGTDGLKATIKDIDKSRGVLNDRLIGTEKRYRAQFTALDVAISRMNSTSNYLTQQLASLSNLK